MTQKEMENFLLFVSDPDLLSEEEADAFLKNEGIDPEKHLNELKEKLVDIKANEKIEKGKKRQRLFDRLRSLSLEGLKELITERGLSGKYTEVKIIYAYRNFNGKETNEDRDRDKMLLSLLEDLEKGEDE